VPRSGPLRGDSGPAACRPPGWGDALPRGPQLRLKRVSARTWKAGILGISPDAIAGFQILRSPDSPGSQRPARSATASDHVALGAGVAGESGNLANLASLGTHRRRNIKSKKNRDIWQSPAEPTAEAVNPAGDTSTCTSRDRPSVLTWMPTTPQNPARLPWADRKRPRTPLAALAPRDAHTSG